jgi:hypothetical protein
LFLVYLPSYEEQKGEQILNDYIGPKMDLKGNVMSKEINADFMLTEDKDVTVIFESEVRPSNTETLKIDLVDPQKREYSWDKTFSSALGRSGKWDASKEYFSFTPKVSGVHHLKISNAIFNTDVSIISGMVNLYDQPFFVVTLFLSFVIMLTCLFSLRKKAIMESMYSGKIVNDIICFCLAVPISWIIVHNIVRW